MPEWKILRVAEIAAPRGLAGGPFGSSLGSKDYVPHGVPVIRGVNLGSERKFNLRQFAYVTPEKVAAELSRNLAQPCDVIFTQRGTLGQVGVVPDSPYPQYVISQSQMRLRVNPARARPEFVYYQFRTSSMVSAIINHAITTGVPHINLSILADLRLSVPPLSTQEAIVDILGALDDKIAANGELTATGEAFIVTLSSGEQQAKAVPLKEIVDHVREQVLPEALEAERVAHYSIPAFDSMRLPEMATPGSIKSSKFIVSAASVLVSKLNPSIPRIWNVDPSRRVPALASTEFLVLRPSQGITTDELWAVCSQPSFTVSLAGKVTGTSNSHQRVKPADLLATEVVDPRVLPAEVRGSISAVARQVHQARMESQSLACLRDALLPKLMSGEIRVREAEQIVEDVT